MGDVCLDHVVHVVRDPQAAALGLAPLGLHALPGGRHPQWGTVNWICQLDLSYLEFLTLEDAARADESAFGRGMLEAAARGDGIWRLALRVRGLEEFAATVRAQGFAFPPPTPGARRRPDGSILAWQLGFPEGAPGQAAPPMLIDWQVPDRERLGDLRRQGLRVEEPPARIAAVAVAAEDPQALARWYAEALALPARPAATRRWGDALRIRLFGGDIYLCGGARAPESVRRRLAQRGEGPFAVHLLAETAKGDGEVEILGALYTYAPI